MDANAFLWIDVAAAVLLAFWIVARRPDLGPTSLRPGLVVFVVGQVVPSLGLTLVRPAGQLPHGIELVLLGIVLPSFVVMFVTTFWLVKACTSHADRRSRTGARAPH